VRPDGGSFHVVVFDPATGAVRERITHQGFADSSTWARGQAWLTYGFTMAYRESGEPEFLRTARRIADYALARLPADGIPCWDYQAPGCPDTARRDASAAAITAAALLELSTFVQGDDARRSHHRQRIQTCCRPTAAEPARGCLDHLSAVSTREVTSDSFTPTTTSWKRCTAGAS
jgi:unsaturated chondroitin disaccharide hydrolase